MNHYKSTIIYYTSNQEDPQFEARVQENILKNCGNLPIISVSQKPINFGKNICVGNIGTSNFNMFRQIEIACEAANTQFVISAEADCIYPQDYFQYIPKQDDQVYRNSNLYVMPDKRSFFFHKKEGATHAQILNRKFYLSILKELFAGAPKWSVEEKNFPKERTKKSDIFDEIKFFATKNPVFQIKTHRGMRYYTHSDRTPIYKLPYWGDGKAIRNQYLYGIKSKLSK